MAKTKRVVMPQLGESVHEGTISKWLVKPGDRVVEFEPMLEVDTDKVNAEVPAPVSGILREILAREGQTVQAGAEIAVVEVAGDVQGDLPSPALPSPPRGEGEGEGRAEPPSPPRGEGQGEVRAAPLPSPPRGEGQGEERAAPLPSPPRGEGQGEGGREPASPAGQGEHRYSPAVQMVAAELKVDLTQITGTGIGGRITKKDVQEFAAKAKAAPAQPAAPAAARPAEGDQVVPLSRVRRLIAENMTRSKTTIPHAWQTQEADMSGVVANRSANKAAFQKAEGFSLTYLP
ncbi:MAG TPA: biotin/lipoyl-containing protein, partial [Candidatus Sulfotelmatobacter sp.]|nr:biotin/lipoyl-containing protein [Candidatus Sulfotelmatobacter sp.]